MAIYHVLLEMKTSMTEEQVETFFEDLIQTDIQAHLNVEVGVQSSNESVKLEQVRLVAL